MTALAPIRYVAVLGAGTMGHGIAQVAAVAGYRVILRDINDEAVTRGRQSIERNLAKAIQLGKDQLSRIATQALARIQIDDPDGRYCAADLVIEAAPENLESETGLCCARLKPLVSPNCIFATNTSSLSISEIASRRGPARERRRHALLQSGAYHASG